MKKLNVACVNVGAKFAPEYVYKLYSMVQKHLTIPHEFICFTDHPENYEGAEFTVYREKSGYQGWWAKLGLFNQENELSGKILYFDLDVVLVRNIDKLIADNGFWIIEDWLDDPYNSSVMLFDKEEYCWLYEQFSWRDMGLKSDQVYIAHKFKTHNVNDVEFFSRKDVQSYKADKCEDYFGGEAKVVVFHGYPKPPDCGGWVQEYWG